MDIFNLSNFDSLKYESKKYQLMARYLEQLVLNRDLKKILELDSNQKYKPYIKYIGGIGNSRALEFCVSKDRDERKSIGNQCDATPLFLADCFRQTGLEADGLSDTGGCFS